MTLAEKVQLVIDIANGQQSIMALHEALADGAEQENFIKTAIDHCVNTTLKQQGGGSMFRFKIVEHGAESFTEWKPEITQFSTSSMMGQLRLRHPHAAISVERQY